MSRIPRTLQRVFYKHRNSLTRVARTNPEQFTGLPSASAFTTHSVHVPNRKSSAAARESDYPFVKRVSAFQKLMPTSQSFDIEQNPEHLKQQNFIEFRTFSHPKIGLEQFRLHLKKYWNFYPKRMFDVKDESVVAIEFEHQSRCPEYPTIVVSELKYDHLSEKNQEIVQSMMDSIPEDKQSDPLQNENFLITGTLWEPITLQEYESIQNESKFAALLSAFGIIPKQSTLNGLQSMQSNVGAVDAAKECEVSWRPAKFKNGTKMVLDTDHPLVTYGIHSDKHVHLSRFNTGFSYHTASNVFRLLVAGGKKGLEGENRRNYQAAAKRF